MIKQHHTIRYIYSKIKQKVSEKKNPDNPWMAAEAIRLLNQLILPSDIGLEFGSGRSTYWLAQRCRHLYSIEHHKQWFSIVKNKLSSMDNLNVDYYLKEIDNDPIRSEYCQTINNFQNNSIDFIIVDGKFRDIISLNGINKLKKGGLLILDDAERYIPNILKLPASIGTNNNNTSTNWNKFIHETATWRKIWTNDGVSATLFLINA